MSQGRILKADEHEVWKIYEDLVEKTLQREPTPEESRIANLISSKRGLHSIETSIAYEAKFDSMARRLEALETKDPVQVKQVSLTQPPIAGCTYCQVMNHVFKECPVYLAHQILPEHMNATCARPILNLYSQTYNPSWRITQISRGVKI